MINTQDPNQSEVTNAVPPEKEQAVTDARNSIANILPSKERNEVDFESFSEDPTALWQSMNLQDGHISEEAIQTKAKEFLVQNGFLNESDIDDGVVNISVEIDNRKLGGEMYDAKYEGQIRIHIDNEYHIYGPAVHETAQQNENGFLTGMGMTFNYTYMGDNEPKLQSADINNSYSW